MKISKIFAGMSAAAIVASMMAALPVSADNPTTSIENPPYNAEAGTFQIFATKSETNDEGKEVAVKDDDGNYVVADDSYITSAKDLAKINGFTVTLTADADMEANIRDRVDNGGEEWMNLGFGVNSDSTGWKQFGEASVLEGDKDFVLESKGDSVYTLTFTSDAPLFTKDESYAQVWVQNWSSCEGNFNVDSIEFTEVEVEPIGNAYIAFGADTKYTVAAATSEASEGKIVLSDWEWGDDSQTWGHYATATAPDFTSDNQDQKDAYDALLAKNEEGKTPTGLTLTGDKIFGFGYNNTEGEWVQTVLDEGKEALVPVLDEETGLYTLVISDIDLSYSEEEGADNKFGCKFFDANWGWGGQDLTEINVTWALNYGEEEVTGSWNTFYYDAEQISTDVKEETATVYPDEEFTLTATIDQELTHMWFVAPTIVFNSEFGDADPNELYDVTVALEINGEAVEIDADIKTDDDGNVVHIWAEDTGSNTKANTARTYGGYNEWADQFVAEEKFEGAEEIKYTITVTEKEQPDPEPEPEPEPTPEPDPTPDPEPQPVTPENPKTGAAALALGVVALAGAAVVVSKRK